MIKCIICKNNLKKIPIHHDLALRDFTSYECEYCTYFAHSSRILPTVIVDCDQVSNEIVGYQIDRTDFGVRFFSDPCNPNDKTLIVKINNYGNVLRNIKEIEMLLIKYEDLPYFMNKEKLDLLFFYQ